MTPNEIGDLNERVISLKQIELMRHALGISSRTPVAWRNYFCVDKESPDYAAWENLVEIGFAVSRPPLDWLPYFTFSVTDSGNAALCRAIDAVAKGNP